VPRYLEELQPEKSSENNIRRLCFSSEGLLFNEFNQIFNEIFSRKARTYRDLVTVLAEGPSSLQKISDALKKERSGHLSACLEDLALSGFIKKHHSPPIGRSGATKIHEYRIIDNYLRFFLKYIAPIEGNIREGLYSNADITTIVPWDSIMGIQFETLVLNNIKTVLTLFDIEPGSVIRAAPYFQRKTNRTRPCQIDLLIETRHTLYICEIKCRDTTGAEVIRETDEKIQRLHVPEKMSVRPCLIHEGTVSPQVRNDGYFDRILSFSEMLKTRPAGE
jgi:predicted transcriptional regulator